MAPATRNGTRGLHSAAGAPMAGPPTKPTATVVQIVPKPGGSDVRALRIRIAVYTRRSRPYGRPHVVPPDDVLNGADVRCLQTLVALLHFELDLLTLLQTAIPTHLDGAVMHEHVSPAVGLRDEPVA